MPSRHQCAGMSAFAGALSGPGLLPLHQRRPAVVGHLDARLRSNCRKNRIYKVFREVGRSVRTVALLRYLAIREVMVGPQANRVGAAEEAGLAVSSRAGRSEGGVDGADRAGTVAHRGGDAFHGPGPDVADSED